MAQCTALSALSEWAHIPARTLTRRARRNNVGSYKRTSSERRQASFEDTPIDASSLGGELQKRQSHVETGHKQRTVLYLAYGSNLCDETFLGKRGIRPLSAINVVVPSAVMTFDLPGIAYSEPCFANIRKRSSPDDEKAPPAPPHDRPISEPHAPEYHKDRWHKGLVGVVYEVTLADYAHIIATEGGGAGYQDVLIACHPLAEDTRELVPVYPTTAAFQAHTLFASAPASKPHPMPDSSSITTITTTTTPRADPSYAQPSARYLALITSGATERRLPLEYQDYLHQIRAYRITTTAQQIGSLLYMALWGPIFTLVLKILAPICADKHGRFPAWLAALTRAMFATSWRSYDLLFKPVFGDGERTLGEVQDLDDFGDDEKAPLVREVIHRYGVGGRLDAV
jgi:hypothetical protein